jgi:hypothetical protein
MDLPRDPGPLGERGRMCLGRMRAAGLRQRPLSLLGPEQVGVARQAERPQADPGERITDRWVEAMVSTRRSVRRPPGLDPVSSRRPARWKGLAT